MTALLIPIFAAINRFRGVDAVMPGQKIVCYLLFGIFAALGAYLDGAPLWWVIGLVVAAGSAFWRQQGRNQYLATVHGRIHADEKANALGNWLAYRVVGKGIVTGYETPTGSILRHNRRWAAWGMAGLGLYATPYIALTAYLAGNPWLMPLALLTASEGVIYWLCFYAPLREDKKTIPAEIMTGALHGGLLWLAML